MTERADLNRALAERLGWRDLVLKEGWHETPDQEWVPRHWFGVPPGPGREPIAIPDWDLDDGAALALCLEIAERKALVLELIPIPHATVEPKLVAVFRAPGPGTDVYKEVVALGETALALARLALAALSAAPAPTD